MMQDTTAYGGKRWRLQSERRSLAGGGCGRRPGGWCYVPGKEVGIGFKLEVLQRRPILMGRGRRGGNKTIQKADKEGGTGG